MRLYWAVDVASVVVASAVVVADDRLVDDGG